MHFEYDNTEHYVSWLYFINVLTFNNVKMGAKQKEWIESLKRYSVQVTQTGEQERYEFLNAQRELIERVLV